MICHLEILQSIPFAEFLPYLAHRVKSVLQDRKGEIKSDAAQLPVPIVQLLETHKQLGRKYAGGSYAGKLTFFRASRVPLRALPDPTGGWGEFVTGGVETIRIPGDHAIWLNEGSVSVLAQQLRKRLNSACRRDACGP